MSNWSAAGAGQAVAMQNEFLSARLDPATGALSLMLADGRPLLRGSRPAATLDGKLTLASDISSSPRIRRSRSSEPLLPGEELIVSYSDPAASAGIEMSLTLLDGRCACVVQTTVTNRSAAELLIQDSMPLRAAASDQGGCHFAAAPEAGRRPCRVVTNGLMYYDPGLLLDFCPEADREFDSYWNAAFHLPATHETLTAAYLENREGIGRVAASWPEGAGAGQSRAFDLTARSTYNDVCVLKPGASIRSGRFLLALSPDPFSGLDFFAETSAKLHSARLNPPINGWCTWFAYYGSFKEADIVRHAEFIARELRPYGMEWIQIDDGYQRSFGDWDGFPESFPGGMKGLAEKIRGFGLKPGLWIAPYAVSAHAPLAKEHPEWLVRDAQGNIQNVAADHQAQAQYILDVTHPGARQWLRDLFVVLTRKWGYDFIKTDFTEWTLLAAGRYHDPAMSKAMAYRLGCETMRKAMGPERHVLDCGPGPVAAGLIDSMRIELDRPTPENPLWDQYVGHPNSTAPAVAKRHFFHQRLWVNDADHIRLGALTASQARCAATITAMSGGNMISSDVLPELDREKLDILRKVLPSFGKGARPMDLFEQTTPSLFALPIRTEDSRSWTLAAVFNWESEPAKRTVRLEQLGIGAAEQAQEFLAYEFWTQQLAPVVEGALELKLEPQSVMLLAIRPARGGAPQVLGTDRHYTQGAVELSQVSWNEQTGELSGTAHGWPGMSWRLAVHVPAGYEPVRESAAEDALEETAFTAPLLRAKVSFAAGEKSKRWALRLKRAAAQSP